ncbi:MAG: hypothetical protein GY925_27465 [Actinomycetia bacterium]|nr:hypothetical protein [Actinomycetes bacterium]
MRGLFTRPLAPFSPEMFLHQMYLRLSYEDNEAVGERPSSARRVGGKPHAEALILVPVRRRGRSVGEHGRDMRVPKWELDFHESLVCTRWFEAELVNPSASSSAWPGGH